MLTINIIKYNENDMMFQQLKITRDDLAIIYLKQILRKWNIFENILLLKIFIQVHTIFSQCT